MSLTFPEIPDIPDAVLSGEEFSAQQRVGDFTVINGNTSDDQGSSTIILSHGDMPGWLFKVGTTSEPLQGCQQILEAMQRYLDHFLPPTQVSEKQGRVVTTQALVNGTVLKELDRSSLGNDTIEQLAQLVSAGAQMEFETGVVFDLQGYQGADHKPRRRQPKNIWAARGHKILFFFENLARYNPFVSTNIIIEDESGAAKFIDSYGAGGPDHRRGDGFFEKKVGTLGRKIYRGTLRRLQVRKVRSALK